MHGSFLELPPPPAGKSGWPWSPALCPVPAHDRAWPKISIVTPSFNQGQFIEATIRSILLQRYPNLEFIVADGGSSDETLSILLKYEPWISSWTSGPDGGQVAALNTAFPKTAGAILGWVNSDDLLLPGSLFAVAELFSLDPETDIVSGARLQRSVRTGTEQAWVPWIHRWPMVVSGFPLVPQEATFFSRRIFETCGPFDDRLDYAFDGLFFSNALAEARRVVLTATPLGAMNAYVGQKSLRADEVMAHNRIALRQAILSRLPAFQKLVLRLCFSRFWAIGDALLRCLTAARAKRIFRIGYYDWLGKCWRTKPLV